MIGYVLLVVIAIVMSLVVYQWVKTYIPKGGLECVDGVSVFLKDVTYDCNTGILDITMENKGRFNVAGFFIHATENIDDELATLDLSGEIVTDYNEGNWMPYRNAIAFTLGGRLFDTNTLTPTSPNNEVTLRFDIMGLGDKKIEITPVRFEEIDERIRFVTCGNARIEQGVSCDVAPVEVAQCDDGEDNDGDGCTDYPEDDDCTDSSDTTESGSVCGTCIPETEICDDELDNDCDGYVDCQDTADCSADPACTNPSECSDSTDNDGDGDIDFPDDLGCTDASDDTEENCGDGICSSGETLATCYEDCNTCDGTWNAGSENVECDGTPLPENCLVDCTCDTNYITNGVGGCELDITGVAGCNSYCALFTGFSDGYCEETEQKCTPPQGPLGGTYIGDVPGADYLVGDGFCGSNPYCCCVP